MCRNVFLCTTYMPGVPGDQKIALDALGQQLSQVVGFYVGHWE